MGAVTAYTGRPGHPSVPAVSRAMPALIKKCFNAMLTGEDETADWGDGKPTRQCSYVDGRAEGDLLATEVYNLPAAVSRSAGFEITINGGANLAVQLTSLEGAPPRTSVRLAMERGDVSASEEQNWGSDSGARRKV
jgi:hypothetical protein